MGKYDDFDLDLDKVKGTLSNTKGGVATISCVDCIKTLLSKCDLITCGNWTCECPSNGCSPSDMTACARNGGNTELLRC